MVPEIVDRCKKHQDTSSNGESCNLGHPWALFFFSAKARQSHWDPILGKRGLVIPTCQIDPELRAP